MDSSEELRELVKELRGLVADLRQTIERQQKRIDQLENRGRDSRTSSRPPSSDAPWTKRRGRRKPPSERSQGAQPGHEGRTRKLVDPDQVDEIQDHRPAECTSCGGAELVAIDRRPHRHQVTELPPVLVHVTEHRLHRAKCSDCGETVSAALPDGVTSSAFGPRLSALTAVLVGVFRLSRREAAKLLEEVFGVSMSVGTVSAIEERMSGGLALGHLQALGSVRRGQVAHVDETPWKERGALRWLWAGVGEHATVFRIDPRRSADAMRRLVGRGYRGVLVTDRMGAYDKHVRGGRQLCWAHLERDFRARELGPRGGQVFGRKARELAQAVLRAHRQYREHGDLARLQADVDPLRRRLRRLLERGAEMKSRAVRGIAGHLLPRFDALWLFADRADVEPTNNPAERAVRKPVLWRKGSFGSQSERGLRFAERILTTTATLRRRGDDLFEHLVAVAESVARNRSPPDLVALPVTR